MSILLRSLWIWSAAIGLIVLWFPLLLIVRAFDRDPVRYRTGRLFRRLGALLARLNPSWQITISGTTIRDIRKPYVVVSNHQSIADIPIIANLPWEMKWVAKKELWRIPFAGWMLRLAGDIPVDRSDRRSGAKMLLMARRYLQQKCSVIFFVEGTRSMDGRVGRFNDGAFHLAIKEQVPVLPIVVEGSRACIPKRSLIFGKEANILLKVLPPVDTSGMTIESTDTLRDTVRTMIVRQIAEWRNASPSDVDALAAAAR
jgi:1-acyl-sn-glycerol-3-phosphate acyltransferase